MKVVYLANNKLGLEILRFLKSKNVDIVGLGLHPQSKQSCGEELQTLAEELKVPVLPGDQINKTEIIDSLQKLCPDLILSVLFGYKLSTAVLQIPKQGCINLHPSYLPYNRGAYPNVWSIVEGTPAGVTLHYMDVDFDTGAIIAQQKVDVAPTDTGKTLYQKLEQTAQSLFCETWPQIETNQIFGQSQSATDGTSHKTKDVEKIDRIDLDKTYTARDLINILRARTFPPHKGAYFEQKGKRVYLNLELVEDND